MQNDTQIESHTASTRCYEIEVEGRAYEALFTLDRGDVEVHYIREAGDTSVLAPGDEYELVSACIGALVRHARGRSN